jgi:hypothetical protein
LFLGNDGWDLDFGFGWDVVVDDGWYVKKVIGILLVFGYHVGQSIGGRCLYDERQCMGIIGFCFGVVLREGLEMGLAAEFLMVLMGKYDYFLHYWSTVERGWGRMGYVVGDLLTEEGNTMMDVLLETWGWLCGKVCS